MTLDFVKLICSHFALTYDKDTNKTLLKSRIIPCDDIAKCNNSDSNFCGYHGNKIEHFKTKGIWMIHHNKYMPMKRAAILITVPETQKIIL